MQLKQISFCAAVVWKASEYYEGIMIQWASLLFNVFNAIIILWHLLILHNEEEFSTDSQPLLMSLYVTQVLPINFPLKCYSNYILQFVLCVLPYLIDIDLTLSYYILFTIINTTVATEKQRKYKPNMNILVVRQTDPLMYHRWLWHCHWRC